MRTIKHNFFDSRHGVSIAQGFTRDLLRSVPGECCAVVRGSAIDRAACTASVWRIASRLDNLDVVLPGDAAGRLFVRSLADEIDES